MAVHPREFNEPVERKASVFHTREEKRKYFHVRAHSTSNLAQLFRKCANVNELRPIIAPVAEGRPFFSIDQMPTVNTNNYPRFGLKLKFKLRH